MKLTTTHIFAATPSEVANMMAEPEYWDAVATRAHALDHSVSVHGQLTELRLSIPAPDSVRGFVGASLTLVQTTRLVARADGNYDSSLSVVVERVPVTMAASGALTASGAGTTMSYDGELTVKIPLVGKKIEREAQPFILDALDAQAQVGRDWLAARSS